MAVLVTPAGGSGPPPSKKAKGVRAISVLKMWQCKKCVAPTKFERDNKYKGSKLMSVFETHYRKSHPELDISIALDFIPLPSVSFSTHLSPF
jgi:hypothetical protein